MSATSPHLAPGLHHDWGRAPYARVHALQEQLIAQRAKNRIPNLLLTGEHDPIITLGRRTPADATYSGEVPRVAVERGGQATYHGPGQLVAYPIVHLIQARRDLHRFQRELEEIGLRVLSDFGIEGIRREGLTGVWVGEQKIQSIGIAVRRWVTWHGLALNVAPDLSAFRSFNPCGLSGDVMTSMAELLSEPPHLADVRDVLLVHAGQILPGGPFVSGPLPDLATDVEPTTA